MEINNDFLKEILTVEELDIIQKIEQKIENKFKELAKHKYDHLNDDSPLDLADQHPDVLPKTHITDAPHEIKISMLAEISSIDDKGYLKEVKEVIKKNYHIPVFVGQDYTDCSDKFFKLFEEKLTSTCQEIINKDVSK